MCNRHVRSDRADVSGKKTLYGAVTDAKVFLGCGLEVRLALARLLYRSVALRWYQ